MKNIQTAMGNISAKRLEKNPNLGNLPMVKAMTNLAERRGTPVTLTGAPAGMPRMGMMGARGMAEGIARRAGAAPAMKKGGKVKKMAKGGSTASKRADGCATKGKTKGKMV